MIDKTSPLPNLSILRSEFVTFISGVRSVTESTVAAYNHDIDTYLEYLANDSKITSNFVITERTLRNFVIFLRARGNADSTIQRRLDGVSAFWKFLYLEYDYERPKSPKDCGIRLKNKRNPTVALPHKQYINFMEVIYNGLREIK